MKHKTWINWLVVLGLLVSTSLLNLTAPPTARAEINAVTILYVEYAASGDCSTWEQACSLNIAVNTADSDTEIWVHAGTYNLSGGGRERELQMKNGVAIYGGFDGTETSREQRNPDPVTNGTIISGDIGVAGDASDNRYHVVTGSSTDSTAILDGFTITGGNADGTNPYSLGGGMYISDGSPTLRNLIISGNTATGAGGGIYNWGGSPTLTNVTFSGNWAYSGGGMYNNDGSSPTLTDVTFSGNSATSWGGGMYNGYSSSPMLTNVTFSGNSANYSGGGMYNWGGLSKPNVRNGILWNNQDLSGTGTITANVYNEWESTITLIHSLVQGSGGSAIWNIDPSYVDGGGNIDSDPLFVEPVYPAGAPTTIGDLHLGADSPAIDAGDNQYVTGIPTDLDGDPRISGGTVDMGAYEYQFFYTLSVSLAGSGAGSVSSAPAGIACGIDCDESYADGTLVTLTASPDTGSTFSGWSGACTNATGVCSLTMTEAKSVIATFTLNQYPLTVTTSGSGGGSVSSDPAGIACPGDCSQTYDYGTLVTLTASPEAGSTFSGWSGACTNASGDCLVTMSDAKSVTATFTLNQYLLTVSLAGDGNGSVSSDPDGIACPGDCSQTYDYGTLVTLTASPEAGSTFSGWSGACTNTTSVCTLTMTAPMEVTATFDLTSPFEVFLPLAQMNP